MSLREIREHQNTKASLEQKTAKGMKLKEPQETETTDRSSEYSITQSELKVNQIMDYFTQKGIVAGYPGCIK